MSVKEVLIVEDDYLVANQLKACLDCSDEFECVGVLHHLEDGLAFLKEKMPDIILVDLGLPDGNGTDLIRFVTSKKQKEGTSTSCLVITMYGDEGHVMKAIEAGAAGYLLKDADYKQVILSLQDLIKGGAPISPVIARALINRFSEVQKAKPNMEAPLFHLTAREEMILQYFAKGFTRKEVANLLRISIHTVNSHTRKIYEKLAVSTQTEAVYKASHLGIISIV